MVEIHVQFSAFLQSKGRLLDEKPHALYDVVVYPIVDARLVHEPDQSTNVI